MLLTHDVAFPSTLGHHDGQHFKWTNSACKTSRIDFVGVLVVSLDIIHSRWGDMARPQHHSSGANRLDLIESLQLLADHHARHGQWRAGSQEDLPHCVIDNTLG